MKFQIGHHVRIKSITDVDQELPTCYSNDEVVKHYGAFGPRIGETAVITGVLNDYYDYTITTDGTEGHEWAMVEADLEIITFQDGDLVRIVQVTDDEGVVHANPTDLETMDWRDPEVSLIGQIGVVGNVEEADEEPFWVNIKLPWNHDREWCTVRVNDVVLHPVVGDTVRVQNVDNYHDRIGKVTYVGSIMVDVTFPPYGHTTAFLPSQVEVLRG